VPQAGSTTTSPGRGWMQSIRAWIRGRGSEILASAPLHVLGVLLWTRLLTARMNITISMGLMSVPVAIMSTVTTMRGSYWFRKDWIRSRGLAPVTR
jgi:hypothetical protein